jgi:hypothetical protein
MNQKYNRIKQIFVALVFLAAIGGFSSCEKNSFSLPSVDPNTIWSFKNDIQPIFTAKCITCHGTALSPDLRDGKSYLALTKGGFVNLPAETSKLYVQMTTNPEHIPRSGSVDKLKVLYWITQGAKNN